MNGEMNEWKENKFNQDPQKFPREIECFYHKDQAEKILNAELLKRRKLLLSLELIYQEKKYHIFSLYELIDFLMFN